MLYITNKRHYYFEVDDKDVVTNDLKDCIIHESEEAMYSYVARETGVDLEEIEGSSIIVTETQATAANGCFYDFDSASAAEYINEFEM